MIVWNMKVSALKIKLSLGFDSIQSLSIPKTIDL